MLYFKGPVFIGAPGALTSRHEETLDRHVSSKDFFMWHWCSFSGVDACITVPMCRFCPRSRTKIITCSGSSFGLMLRLDPCRSDAWHACVFLNARDWCAHFAINTVQWTPAKFWSFEFTCACISFALPFCNTPISLSAIMPLVSVLSSLDHEFGTAHRLLYCPSLPFVAF